MVLEETLTLNNIDDVKELTWTFLDAGIKVRISRQWTWKRQAS